MNLNDYTIDDFVSDESFQAFAENSKPEAAVYWQNWIKDHPQHAEKVQFALKWLNDLKLREVPLSDEQLHQAETKLMNAVETYENNRTTLRVAYRRRVFQWAAAACVGLLVLAGGNYWWQNRQPEFVTNFGETRSLSLPDGSTVVLNAHSRLRISAKWNAETPREVWLEGEAFFNVKHTLNHNKFVVHTQDANIEVLGTTFNVLKRNHKTQVVLSSGRVKLTRPADHTSIIMQPGELVEVRDDAPKVVQQKVNIEPYVSWKNNQFVFDNTPLSEIVEMIESNYGFEVVVENSQLLRTNFTYRLQDNDLDLLLATLSEALELDIKKENNSLIINKK